MIDRLLNMIGIGSVTLGDDDGELQLLQVTERTAGTGIADRVLDKVRRVTEFGFSSFPPLGAEALMARRGGERAQSMVIGTNHRPSRPRGMKQGETMIYDVRGQRVYLSADGIVIDGGNADLPVTVRNVPKLRVEATQVECTGDIVGFSDGQPISLKALHDAYAAHRHGGVSAGTAKSDVTDHQV